MTKMVDDKLFVELAGRRVEEVVCAPYCRFDHERDCYTVSFWDGQYALYPKRKEIEPLDGTAKPHGYLGVFLINYLLSPHKKDSTGKWISEKDLTGGSTFFRGPHAIPTERIVSACGDDLEGLRQRCLVLGGTALDMADCSFAFDIIGGLRLALLYWRGDEEFPAEARLLLDESARGVLKLDVVYGLLCYACLHLAGEADGTND